MVASGERCHECRREVTDTRLVLPRRTTGDIVFCGWGCQEDWRVRAVKLTPVQRLDMQEEVISLAGRAISLGYPPHRLPMRVRDLDAYSHEDLSDRYLRLKAWVAEREEHAETQR